MDILSTLLARDSEWTTREERYFFPQTLKDDRTFKDVSEIRELLQKEAKDRGLYFDNQQYAEYKWAKGRGQYCRFRCRICQSEINILQMGEVLMVGHVDAEHVHGPEQAEKLRKSIRDMKMKELKTFHSRKAKRPKLRVETAPSSEFPIKEEPDVKLQYDSEGEEVASNDDILMKGIVPHQIAKQVSSSSQFKSLKKWLKEHHYEVHYQQCRQQLVRYPPVMLIVSPYMLENFTAYGDVLNFHTIEGLLRKGSNSQPEMLVGALTVYDHSSHILFAGLAIIQKGVKDAARLALQLFLTVHKGNQPFSIVTTDDPLAVEAVSSLIRGKVYRGAHLLSPTDVMRTVHGQLTGSREEIAKAANGISNAMLIRDKSQFNEAVDELLAKPASKDVLRGLIENSKSAFYCLTGDSFVGLQRSIAFRCSETILRGLSSKTLGLLQFMQKFNSLKLYANASDERLRTREGIELLTTNGELAGIREMFSAVAVNRFAENYVGALLRFDAKAVKGEESHKNRKWTVEDRRNPARKFSVDEQCECKEFEKTGVACSHLIATALLSGRVFSDLISTRWSTQLQSRDQ